MNRVLLVRHGAADGHEGTDPALSALGIRQMSALAERLRDEVPLELLHGPRKRARQSAEILGRTLGIDPCPTDLLEDRTPHPSPGRWEDYPRSRWEWLEQTPAEERDLDATALDAAWRCLGELREHSDHGDIGRDPGVSDGTEDPGTLIAITHAFVIGSFVRVVLDAPADAWLRMPAANAGLTELRRRPSGDWAVHSMHDVGHLVGLP